MRPCSFDPTDVGPDFDPADPYGVGGSAVDDEAADEPVADSFLHVCVEEAMELYLRAQDPDLSPAEQEDVKYRLGLAVSRLSPAEAAYYWDLIKP